MTMALPARRAAVGMVAVAVPAVRTRPPVKETYMMRCAEVSVFAFLSKCFCVSIWICICQLLPAAVDAALTGSTIHFYMYLYFNMYCTLFLYVFLTGSSECDGDGVNNRSGSSRDGEEAACQSEDDKALEVKMIISYVLIHLQI